MFGSQILEIVIGLVFVYLLLSLLASTINELIMRFIYSRGKNLKIAIQSMLDDDTSILSEVFFEHPFFKKFRKPKSTKFPSYISNKSFSKILLEVIQKDSKEKTTLVKLNEKILALPESKIRDILVSFSNEANGNIEKFREEIENWFEEMMNRASGWYKRKVQIILLIIGLIISIIFNADTFTIARKLSEDPDERAKIVELALDYHDYLTRNDNLLSSSTLKEIDTIPANTNSSERIPELTGQIDSLINNQLSPIKGVLGMGWNETNWLPKKIDGKDKIKYLLIKILGWLITAFAISLGAPFWFDILNKAVNFRSAGKPPGVSEQKSKTPGDKKLK